MGPEGVRYRYEPFGGILATERPPLLVFVDRDFMRGLGLPASPVWTGERVDLTAPIEAHLLLSRRCPTGCAHCYTGSTPDGAVMDVAFAKAAIDRLAEVGVFHVALGGGESLLDDTVIEVAHHARARGIVPNLTTSGVGLTEARARAATVFGRVNVSIDAVEGDRGFFGVDRLPEAERAVERLRERGVAVGLNTVLTRANYAGLEAVVRWAADRGADDVEWLRLKPFGRAAGPLYRRLRLTEEQALGVFPLALALSRDHRIPVKMDCSFGPMIFCHDPDARLVQTFDIVGCDGGHRLVAVFPEGAISACSFVGSEGDRIERFAADWSGSAQFAFFRTWAERALEPCASCPGLEPCKGGCHAVSRFVVGDPGAPDPECPRVVAWQGRDGDGEGRSPRP